MPEFDHETSPASRRQPQAMTPRLPPSASIATALDGDKLCAPSALRNLPAVLDLLAAVAPPQGRALEIASGTGQHITALARALPRIDWQPSEIAARRIASINAYATGAALPNLRPALLLDASRPGWPKDHPAYDLVYMGNLLHLISQPAARAVLTHAATALAPRGKLVLYGPFLRAGKCTSEGDARFDTELRAADPAIGYKDDRWVKEVLTQASLTATLVRKMPANNLAFIAQREPE